MKLCIMMAMDKKAEVDNALKNAMRSGDNIAKRTLRMAVASIRMAEMDKGGPLDEAGVMAVLQKEVKSRQESIAEAQRANRQDLASAAEDEIRVLENFLPKQMSREELEALVSEVIEEVGASSPADMGRVMKELMPRLQGRAKGDQASEIVRQQLLN
jgi:uncharacterized protein